MTKRNDRVKDPSQISTEVLMGFGVAGTFITTSGVIWLSATLANKLAGNTLETAYAPRVIGVMTGATPFPPFAWVFVVACFLVITALGTFAIVSWSRRKKTKTRVDDAARHMAQMSDLRSLSPEGATETAERLGVAGSIGVPIAKHLATGTMLYASWEDVHVDIWGPRQGKSASRAIPAILDAPGAVITTSNKRDVLDATRDPRSIDGRCAWVFDPQQLAEEPSDIWFWDPLSYVTDEDKALSLAQHFAHASREPGARADAYFDGVGTNLLADLILAAALGQHPITQVYRWVTRPTNNDAVKILEEHDYQLQADRLSGVIAKTERQRDGIYGTAEQMVSCLTSTKIQRWICRQGDNDDRVMFDPHKFVRSNDTLYSLSMEGVGSAGPITTALTVAVAEAAVDYAKKSKGGRLPIPLVAVLDEAANVCRWKQLPDLYSHFGSRGIILMTILQSWSQGVDVWGERGMAKLWSAANVRVYGGNVDEEKFLEDRSKIIGDHELIRVSTSVSGSGMGSRSSSRQVQKERTMPASELAALPKGRAIVFSAGNRVALVRTVPWMHGPYAEAVEASILNHDPKGEDTLTQGLSELFRAENELEQAEAAA